MSWKFVCTIMRVSNSALTRENAVSEASRAIFWSMAVLTELRSRWLNTKNVTAMKVMIDSMMSVMMSAMPSRSPKRDGRSPTSNVQRPKSEDMRDVFEPLSTLDLGPWTLDPFFWTFDTFMAAQDKLKDLRYEWRCAGGTPGRCRHDSPEKWIGGPGWEWIPTASTPPAPARRLPVPHTRA